MGFRAGAIVLALSFFGQPAPPSAGSPLPAPGFHHLHLNSVDPAAAIDFYVKAFPSTSKIMFAGQPALSTPNNVLLLFNKDTTPHTAQISLAAPLDGAWTLYRFDTNSDVTAVQSGNIAGSALTLANLPPRSANLLVLPSGDGPSPRVFRDGFESP